MRSYRPGWTPTSIDPDSYTDRLTGLCASFLTFETDCPECGGEGEVEYVREKRLDELTGIQQEFLLRADLERDSPDEEQQQEIEQTQAQAQVSGHGSARASAPSTPSPSRTPSPRR